MGWFSIGDVEIARIVEFNEPFWTPSKMFPEATPEVLAPDLEWLVPNVICPVTGKLLLPIQSYVVRTTRHLIMLDTCVGHHKTCGWYPRWHDFDGGTYLSQMAALGVQPEDIDYVLCTHLHIDHSGWNTRRKEGRWIPTFANATYLFTKQEFEYSQSMSRQGKDPSFEENVAPIMEAGQAALVEMDHELDEQIRLEPTPGHTPGHVAIHISSRGGEAVTAGDLIQSPLQCRHPDWSFIWDHDQDQARRTRREFLEAYADTDVTVLTSHFPLPSIGRIRSLGECFDFEYFSDDELV